MSSHRILYVGYDITLLKTLMDALDDCQMVRCPGSSVANILIKSEIGYALFLLDEELPGTSGRELAHLMRRVRHRERTPIIILSASKLRWVDGGISFEQLDDHPVLVSAIEHLLAAPR